MASVIPMEVRASHEFGFNLGLKLIRGAYMNEEREIAMKKGVESPVWDSIDETHACYNNNVEHVIPRMKPHDLLLVASHNKESCEIAMELATEHCLVDRIRFGQLKGFSDQITGDIANKGFPAFKYQPFGPTE